MAGRARQGLLAIGLMLAAAPALAEIDFAAMQAGCKWTVRYSSGQTITETFLGLKSGKYRTEVTEAGHPDRVVRRSSYDRKGRLVRKDWAGGKWETFTPFSCFSIPGSCSYVYANADGVKQKIVSETTASGDGFRVSAGPVGGTPYPDEYFELGQFGLMTRNKSSNYSARLVKIENCDIES